ncbi:Hypothetical protein KVN_LOCUS471 [uncultured virus]|nr:Hypothetical protein KVN_LOCUS471 [uncultured virus]
MHNNIIFYYFLLNQYLIIIKRRIKLFFLNICEVKVIESNNKLKDELIRFICISFLHKFIVLLDKIKKYIQKIIDIVDIKIEKIQIAKVLSNNDKHIILESNFENKLTLSSAYKTINSIKNSEDMLNSVILNFELIKKNGNNISLKDFFIKYRDKEYLYNNTIKNIFLFNNIIYDQDDKIYIKKFDNGTFIHKTFITNEIENRHINSFLEIKN